MAEFYNTHSTPALRPMEPAKPPNWRHYDPQVFVALEALKEGREPGDALRERYPGLENPEAWAQKLINHWADYARKLTVEGQIKGVVPWPGDE